MDTAELSRRHCNIVHWAHLQIGFFLSLSLASHFSFWLLTPTAISQLKYPTWKSDGHHNLITSLTLGQLLHSVLKSQGKQGSQPPAGLNSSLNNPPPLLHGSIFMRNEFSSNHPPHAHTHTIIEQGRVGKYF